MSLQKPDPGAKAGDPAADTDQSLLLALLPRAPLMMRVAVMHMLRLSEQSKYLDLRTEMIIALMRSFVHPPQPQSISTIQRMAAKAPPLKGKIWISTYTCPPPPREQLNLQAIVARGIDELWDPNVPKAAYHMPDPVPVEAEWTGYRADATAESALPGLPPRELYTEMMKEVRSPLTILYFHGGGHMVMDPATHRPTTKTLAKLTSARVYSVRYRLAPQNPFPAALMDALQSYL
ncbi:hypothetical protein BT67DRAFT_378913, partial [Trichocladium antarcticum]